MTALALTPINGEPRIHDLLLAERLGFERLVKVRDIIKRNEAKLLKFGVLPTVGKTSGDQGGRPTTEFYLNQKQAIFICMKSETEKALDVQVEIVHVFDAYLNSESTPEPSTNVLATQLSELLNGKVLVDFESLELFINGLLAAQRTLRNVGGIAQQIEQQCGRTLFDHRFLSP
ncbi:MAG: hypothetical protein H6974_12860 [Gammaproteobacteria bacterium]|nr:hypothetical protein [Gammaproteobacteria bacterium]